MSSTLPLAADPAAARTRGLALVFLAGLFYASAGLFTRALPYEAWTLLAWRSLAGGLFTCGALVVETGRLSWRDYRMSPAHWVLVPVGAVATACYVVALTITTVANVMIVYATSPFVTALVAWLWTREVPSRRLLVASTVALLGVAVMIGGGTTRNLLQGAALILVMNLGFALMLTLARHRPRQSMTPVNGLSLLLASAIGFALAPAEAVPPSAMLLLVAFGVTTVGVAMLLFMAGAKVAPPAEVALVGISDVVLGPAMVFLAFGEDPGPAALAGGGIVVGALVWNAWPALRRRRAGRWVQPSPVAPTSFDNRETIENNSKG